MTTMWTALILGALAAGPSPQAADTLFPLEGATRIQVQNRGGLVEVRGWDRNEVRLEAEHSSRTAVRVRRRGDAILVEPEGIRGPAVIADLRLTVPRGLEVRVEGMSSDVLLEGLTGEVRASTVNSPIRATETRGRLDVSSVSGSVEVAGATGEVFAESVSGAILLRELTASTVEAGTVSGSILYDGVLQPGGRYSFGSHSGSLSLHIPGSGSAAVDVASLSGRVEVDLPGAVETASGMGRRRSLFTLGGGEVRVELETFSGAIALRNREGAQAERALEGARERIQGRERRGGGAAPLPPQAPLPPGGWER